ncbi:MAG: hypothetical protein AB7V32_06490, partial [Candidatus Berkiella sp.]
GKEGDIIPTGAPLVDVEGEAKKDTGTVAGEIKVGEEIIQEKPPPLAVQQVLKFYLLYVHWLRS